jgi:hypothetical protein
MKPKKGVNKYQVNQYMLVTQLVNDKKKEQRILQNENERNL